LPIITYGTLFSAGRNMYDSPSRCAGLSNH
jgi:hypothetical protein